VYYACVVKVGLWFSFLVLPEVKRGKGGKQTDGSVMLLK
jgi:hypothetical protein